MKRICFLSLILLSLLLLIACNNDSPPATTESSSESITESGTESQTETETEMQDPHVLTLDALDTLPSDVFARPQFCRPSLVNDPSEGKVIRLTTTHISAPGQKNPTVYLSLSQLADAMNVSLPSTASNPYLVLKVRANDLWSHTFRLFGGQSTANAKPFGDDSLLVARMDNTSEWQYIYFDLSIFPKKITTLFINFEYLAGEDGENIDIAEIRFVRTEKEAIALCGEDVYPTENPDLAEGDLRVISYNIWVGNGTDTVLRADIFRDFLDTYRPDSIGMQEVAATWRAAFDKYFVFNDSYAGVGVPRDGSSEASMIYYRVDKYELIDSGTFWLSDTPDVEGSLFSGANYPRICTWVHLRDRVTGRAFVHANTHLDHNGQNDSGEGGRIRSAQIKVLLEFINTFEDIPVILTGDFNSTAYKGDHNYYEMYEYVTGMKSFIGQNGTEITASLSDARLDAANVVYHAGGIASMTKYFDESHKSYDPDHLPIDYQFHSNHLQVLLYQTELNFRDDAVMSDHLPVICDYAFTPADEYRRQSANTYPFI